MIYVIEPHADDAFLSLGGHIEEWRKEKALVTIVTVFSGTRKRARDAKAYADAVGAIWIGLDLVEGVHLVKDVEKNIKLWLGVRDYDHAYIVPLAVTHPEHKLVRDLFEKYVPKVRGDLLYYLDQPYASITKNGPTVVNASKHFTMTGGTRGMELYSWRKPHSRKYRHIPLFRDQAKFFHFNPAERLKHNVEVILR